MKKILLLTDFSRHARHASNFALAIASHTDSQILLFNSFYVSEIVSPVEGIIPAVLEKSSRNDLELAAEELRQKSNYRIEVSCETAGGGLIDNVNQLLLNHHVWLIVMGEKNSGNFSYLFWSNHAKDIIETATCPVLMVPIEAKFMGFRRIAYALDHNGTPVAALNLLREIFQAFLPEIFIIHVNSHSHSMNYKNIERFINEAGDQKISFFELKESDPEAAIRQFIEENEIGLLVVQHFKEHTKHRQSFTRALMKHNEMPILVMPAYLEI